MKHTELRESVVDELLGNLENLVEKGDDLIYIGLACGKFINIKKDDLRDQVFAARKELDALRKIESLHGPMVEALRKVRASIDKTITTSGKRRMSGVDTSN